MTSNINGKTLRLGSQNELLMERLKTKSTQHRNFQEIAKAMRMTLLEKRYALDHVEKSNLQKCLDAMQHCIKVTSRQGLVERLESLTRQLGLKFMEEDQSRLFISSDMFYLEIVLDKNGVVSDVKVHHEGNNEQQSCSELVDCLCAGDFTDFTQQLEGLASIYQLNTEQKLKSKAYVALQALETDLTNLFMIQNVYTSPQALLCKSAVGILKTRRGGHPMRLTFFVTPYDLIDFETQCITPMSIDLINSKNIGMSVTVNLEASAANKLQTMPLIMINKDQQGRNSPVYSPFTPLNSTLIPASFVLRLNKSLAISYAFVQKIRQITESQFGEQLTPTPILGLIAKHESNGVITSPSKGLFVSLPDQNHCYFITNSSNLDGVIINSVPFTEPSHVPQILVFLRTQAAFNSLISSCIRVKGRHDLENAVMFEVSAISCQNIIVSLEHPFEESVATVEINLSDLTNIVCKIYTLGKNYDNISGQLSKIIQKCMSIPVTMRYLINYWEQESIKLSLNSRNNSMDNGNFNLSHGSIDPGGDSKLGKGGNGVRNSSISMMFHQGGNATGTSESSTFSDGMFISNENSSLLNQLVPSNPNTDADITMTNNTFNNDLSISSKATKKRRITNTISAEDFWKNPKSNKLDVECTSKISTELLLDCSTNQSSDSNSLGLSAATTSESGVAMSPSSQNSNEFPTTPEIEFQTNFRLSTDIIKNTTNSSKECTDSLSKISSSVSITPIPPNISTVLTGLEKRPGIEIFPFATATAQSLPSSITITPINTTKLSSESRKSLSSSSHSSSSKQRRSSDDKRPEKKKKKRRDDSPMGPPEKLPPAKTDGSSKPTSGSKSGDDGYVKKYSSSLTSSPPIHKSGSSPNSVKSSPKNSPVYHANSPKHSGLHSPKHSSSPKQHTSSGSGKPSMSQLKSATNSPSSIKSSSPSSSEKSSKVSSTDRDRDRERSEKKSVSSSSASGLIASSKIKQPSVKLTKTDISVLVAMDLITTTSGGNSSSGDGSSNTSSSSPESDLKIQASSNSQNKNRKSSLSAVIDKLKSVHHAGDEDPPSHATTNVGSSTAVAGTAVFQNLAASLQVKEKSTGNKETKVSSTTITPSSTTNKVSEYMVKPSSDGMKITINKTKSKDSSSKDHRSSGSGSNSPSSKSSSGTKSGLNSSVPSKKISVPSSGLTSLVKTPSLQKSNSSGNLFPSISTTKSTTNKSVLQKTSSSGSLPSAGSSELKREKSKFSSCSLSSSSSGSGSSSKSSTSDRNPFRGDASDVMKLLAFQSTDGFIKTLDTKKFQIPKLSARSSTPSTVENNHTPPSSEPRKLIINESPSETRKMLADLLAKDLPHKYPFTINKLSETTPVTNNSVNHRQYGGYITTDLTKDITKAKALSPNLQITSVPPSFLVNSIDAAATNPNSLTSTILAAENLKLPKNLSIVKENDSPTVKLMPLTAPPADEKVNLNEVLDFSSTSTSSVSLHIVKSPSVEMPHSNNCIGSDDLLGEGELVGTGGK